MTNIERARVLDLLSSLAAKSLIAYDEVGPPAGRYRMLETIRQYAGERLGESGEAQASGDRHAGRFLKLAEEAEPQLTGPDQAAWLARLESEHDNLRASLAWYEKAADGFEAGLRLSGALWRFWAVRGHYVEGRHRLTRILDRTSGAAGSAKMLAARAKSLNGLGYLACRQGDYAVARAWQEQSLAIHQRLEDQRGVAFSLNELGRTAEGQGDYASAQALHKEALTVRLRLGDAQGAAMSLGNLGLVAYAQGDLVEAQRQLEASISIQQRLGDEQGAAMSLGNLGLVAYARGDLVAAWDLHEEGLTLFRQLGDQRGIANSLNNLGNVAYAQRDDTKARTRHEESLMIQRRLGDRQGIAYSLEGLAAVAHVQHPARAARLLGAAASLRAAIASPLPPGEQEEVDRRVVSVREALGADVFATVWTEGQSMTEAQAVELAMTHFSWQIVMPHKSRGSNF